MGGHDRVDAFPDGQVKRDQLERVQARAVRLNHRKPNVRVDRSVPVPGEVLACRISPALLGTPYEGGAQAGHQIGVGPERAARDHRIVRIVVHVQDGREQEVHSARAGLHGRNATVFVCEALIPDRAERHRRWKRGASALGQHGRQRIRTVDAHAGPAVLEVGGDEQGDLRARL